MVLYITVDKGTMFGGKSSTLERLYRQYKKKNVSILSIKHSIDNRYDSGNNIVTHDGKKMPCVCMKNLMDIDLSLWDVVIIDEAQWFEDLYDFISSNFNKFDTRIHIAGLNGDKHQKSFGDINRISPFCSEERVHYAMCAVCGDSAPFTKYRGDSDCRDIIGGDDDYYTVCHKHLHIPSKDIDKYH